MGTLYLVLIEMLSRSGISIKNALILDIISTTVLLHKLIMPHEAKALFATAIGDGVSRNVHECIKNNLALSAKANDFLWMKSVEVSGEELALSPNGINISAHSHFSGMNHLEVAAKEKIQALQYKHLRVPHNCNFDCYVRQENILKSTCLSGSTELAILVNTAVQKESGVDEMMMELAGSFHAIMFMYRVLSEMDNANDGNIGWYDDLNLNKIDIIEK